MLRLGDTLSVDPDGWRLVESGFDVDRSVAVGSNFMVGNGYLGYRATSPEQSAADFVALVVSDTYDCADGHWRELSTAPNPLFVSARVGTVELGIGGADEATTALDLRDGVFSTRWVTTVGDATVVVEVERFASYDQLHLLAQRWVVTVDRPVEIELAAGIDADVWSLNGTHLPSIRLDTDRGVFTAFGSTVESGIDLAVAADVQIGGAGPGTVTLTDRLAGTRTTSTLAPGHPITVTTIAVVRSSNDGDRPLDDAIDRARSGSNHGYDELLERSRRGWAAFWDDTDVVIEGHPVDQAVLRFNAHHNRICTPAHSDHLPIGARGLSCQAYQGSAFWDQEVYNLPAFLFTEPHIARSLLVYRYRTLDGARRKAQRLGYDGAYYAWVSGLTGDELCPDVFFTDVLTGRPIRNHFNVWQMHVAPDIVTTIARYLAVTDDIEFLYEHGAEIAFEVARFLRSFVRYDDWRGVYHCIRLLGPDEWHENVDDNAFTNHQTHAALAFAIETHERMSVQAPNRLAEVVKRLGLAPAEIDAWRRVRDEILLPAPDPATGLIEQFAGFFQLEDVTPDEVRDRLLDPNEYWGWPNGVAVRTQVSKQADVVMLLWLHRRRFGSDVARRNYDYYEPRCSHASSLSHTAHAMVAIGIGDVDRALDHHRAAATVDLLNTNHAMVGGTFIGGIHTAACGGAYQVAVQGFGGLDVSDGVLTVDPMLPDDWESLTYPVRWRGQRLTVSVRRDEVVVGAHSDNQDEVAIRVSGETVGLEPGATITV